MAQKVVSFQSANQQRIVPRGDIHCRQIWNVCKQSSWKPSRGSTIPKRNPCLKKWPKISKLQKESWAPPASTTTPLIRFRVALRACHGGLGGRHTHTRTHTQATIVGEGPVPQPTEPTIHQCCGAAAGANKRCTEWPPSNQLRLVFPPSPQV